MATYILKKSAGNTDLEVTGLEIKSRKPSHVHWVTPERIFRQKLQTSGPWTTSGTQTCFVWPPQSSKKSFSQRIKLLRLQIFFFLIWISGLPWKTKRLCNTGPASPLLRSFQEAPLRPGSCYTVHHGCPHLSACAVISACTSYLLSPGILQEG